MKFKAKIKSYSYETNEITLSVSFITDEILLSFEKGMESDKLLTVDIAVSRGDEGSYEQQKKIWAMTREILLFLHKKNPSLLVNSVNLRAVYEASIRQLFPARTLEIDGATHTYLPSMGDLTMEERAFVIEQIEDKYSPMGVDFDAYQERV